MNERCRTFDWAATPLGPVEGWSQSLRTTVSILLNSRSPMFLFWGPELVQFYNDAYRPSLGSGERHPKALGATGRDFWTEVWSVIGPEIEQVMTTGVSTWHEDAYIPIERDGGLADVWWTYGFSPVFDDDGSIRGTLVVCQETTANVLFERERENFIRNLHSAVTALRDTEAQLRDQFAKMPVATTLWERADDDFVLVAVNDATELTAPGLRAKAGSRRQDIFPGTEDIAEDYRRCLREDVIIHRSAELLGALGAPRYLEFSIGPQQPNRVLVHTTDVTERKALEIRVHRSERMESVGLLAGGIAHDFNNLMTVIGVHNELLLEEIKAGSPNPSHIEAIGDATARAASLTRQLLAFGRKQIMQPTYVNANEVVDNLSGMLRGALGTDIAIETTLGQDSGIICIDASQLEQAITNLVFNAADAMPHGGTLTICTDRLSMAAGHADTGEIVVPGDYLCIEVRDTGIGMDASVRERAFEPFFTTKDQAAGRGMGLATVYGIAKQSAGYVTLESAPGQGTTARMLFPIIVPKENALKSATVPPATPSVRGANHESILLIEDEAGVRMVANRVLTKAGYKVFDAASGAAGLKLAEDITTPLHMVLSDVVMPDMGGAEVVERVRARRPGIRAAVMSGYTDDEVMRRGIGEASVAFLRKPFTAAQLTRFVREVLDSRPQEPATSGSPAEAAGAPAGCKQRLARSGFLLAPVAKREHDRRP